MEAMNTTTMNPAATGIGAAVSTRPIRPSPRDRDAKCSQTVYAADAANSAKNTVLTVTPAMRGMSLLNGTP